MHIGYILSDLKCEFYTYENYEKCPNRAGEVESVVNFYKTFVQKTEDITFVPFEILSPEPTSNSSSNATLLGALANEAIDVYIASLAITPIRFETLSFTTPHAFDRICFYMKRPEKIPVTDQPLFFLSPFTMHTWLILALTLAVVTLSSQFIDYVTINCSRRYNFLALKLMSFLLLLTEGLLSVSYLTALREVLIEKGSLKPPFGNRYESGSRLCTWITT